MLRKQRLKKEIESLEKGPPPGITCFPVNDFDDQFEAQIIGSDNTPYKDGLFKLSIDIPNRYPFEPPKITFVTSIYHPNIDSSGRICLDLLKMPPIGSWNPTVQLASVLMSVQLLMQEPNPDDPLMMEIAQEFKSDRMLFERRARACTIKYAFADCHNSFPVEKNENNDRRHSSNSSDDSNKNNKDDDDDDISRELNKYGKTKMIGMNPQQGSSQMDKPSKFSRKRHHNENDSVKID